MTNFTNTNKTKGVLMNREQKASRTYTPNTGLAAKLSTLFRSKGTSAPSSRRLRTPLAVLALAIAAFAVIAAPAFAAPPTAKAPEISEISYTSVHVTGTITSDGSGNFTKTAWAFEYSTDEATWSIGVQSTFETNLTGAVKDAPVEGTISGLKGGTKYFIRLAASNGFAIGSPPEVVSPEPYPSFTTLTADPTSVVSIDAASEVAYTTAKATGVIDRPVKSNDVTCHFEYITDDQFTNNPPGEGFIGALQVPCDTGNPGETPGTIQATGHVPVSAELKELGPATPYHLRLAVSNAANADAKEAPSTFTTLTVDPPSVKSIQNASEVEFSRAQVKGVVERPGNPDPAFDINPCYFEYVTDQQFNENPSGEEFAGAAQTPCETEPPENPITATGQTPVKATLPGLSASTTYHLRLSATNLGGTDSEEAASTFTTAGPIPAPSVISIEDATNVTSHEAHVSGTIQRPAGADPALDTSCRFEYVTDQQFSETGFEGAPRADCNEAPFYAPLTTTDPTPVTADLTGLKADTTFHLRLVAETVGGSTDSKDAAAAFTTLEAEKPTVSIDPLPSDAFTAVHVSGMVGGEHGTYDTSLGYFEMSSDGGASWSRTQWVVFGDHPIEHDYTGLQPETTYLFRIIGWNEDLTGFSPDRQFELGNVAVSATESITTQPLAAPTVVLDPVSEITTTSAHLSGSVDTHAPAGPLSANGKAAYETKWHFECAPECKDRHGDVIGGTVQGEEGSQPIAADLEGLLPNTHYKVKLVAENILLSAEAEEEFDTPLIKPTVTALPGGSDGEGGYVLSGTVNPNNSPITNCEFKWGPDSNYVFKADCSPPPGGKAKAVTVEAHLTGLNPGSVYHADLIATNAAGTEDSKDFEFIPTLAEKGPACPNEQLREENGSLGLPECRAYEMTTYPNKEGASANFSDLDGGDALLYSSSAQNLANSGGRNGVAIPSYYVATRTAVGWETIPDLNGPTGSLKSAPEFIKEGLPALYSTDLLSSIWAVIQAGDEPLPVVSRRAPDGSFTRVGKPDGAAILGGKAANSVITLSQAIVGGSVDLSHVVVNGGLRNSATYWGPGVYEFVGTGNDLPRRVDLDNSGEPIPSCRIPGINPAWPGVAQGMAVSTDGRVIVVSVQGGCGGDNPPANEIWARVGGTTSYDVSASRCNRTAPAEPCNAPADATYQGAAKDGSRIYFTTKQQLVNGDTDQTNDLYACDIPPGTPTPSAEPANPCSALHEASAGSAGKANVQKVVRVSDDGSTAYFTARGVLAGNEDALKEEALPGDENLYVWRTDTAHPDGQIGFVARLPEGNPGVAQTTPDGRYLVLQTAGQLLPTDTDEAADVYRYDAATEEMARVSTAVSGAGGNGPFDAQLGRVGGSSIPGHNSHLSISDDGKLIVFATEEALSPLDGNGEPDAYLWNEGHALGSVAPLLPGEESGSPVPGKVFIDGSGQDIYVQTAARLTPTDVDTNSDIYDIRIDGGFPQSQEGCAGEVCQPPASNPPATPASPANTPNGEGNIKPKTCPKGKVVKGKKCVKRHNKKHKAKHHKKSHKKHGAHKHKRTGSNNGGGR